MADPFVGQLTFIRVYSGQLKSGDSVLNAGPRTHRAHWPPAEDARQQARRYQRNSGGRYLRRGRLEERQTGDTICDEKHPIALESITFAVPVISVAVEPKTKADQEKMGMALSKLAQEDPTFKVHTDPDSGQTIISGMGELHLEIIVDRMMREYKVEANVGKPQVAYRETIRRKSEAEGKYIRQTGGRGQYGHAKIRIEPQRARQGLRICQRYRRRLGAQGIHQADRSGHSGSDGRRHPGRLRDGRCESHALRRQLSRRRFQRNGVQDCRFDGLQGSRAQGFAGAARAGDGGRSSHAGRLCRRRSWAT